MTICITPDSTATRILKHIAQCDRKNGKTAMSRFCRDEFLKSVSKEITKARSQGAHYAIVSGDFNQDIGSNYIQIFMRKKGLFEVHREVSNIEGTERDRTHKKARNQVDAALATGGILVLQEEANKWTLEKC